MEGVLGLRTINSVKRLLVHEYVNWFTEWYGRTIHHRDVHFIDKLDRWGERDRLDN